MAGPTTAGPERPPMPKMTGMLITLVLMLVLMFFYDPVGKFMNDWLFFKALNFNYEHAVVTLMLAGLIMTMLSTIIRAVTTDMVKQQRNQSEMKAFNAELRQARIENNLYKIKKLTEMQQKMMAKNMEGMTTMMKTMPITMMIVIPIFAWVRYFIENAPTRESLLINVPWAQDVFLNDSILLPIWIFIYILVSIPIGQLINRLIRTYLFKKRLKELDSGTGGAEVEVA